MSSELQEPQQDVPTYGVRNSSEMAYAIHRDDDGDNPHPACREGDIDRGDFVDVHIPSHLPFARWRLCQNPKCFGEDDEDVDRGEGIETDGGRSTSAAERIECWNCGYERFTFEACPECGEYGGDA